VDSKDLKGLREAAGLSQIEVAAAIDYSGNSYNRIENGHRPLPRKKIDALAKALNCTVEDIENSGIEIKGVSIDPDSVAARIIEARRLQGLSQGEFAARVGLSQVTISRLETGAQAVQLGTLQRISAVLGYDMVWFLGRENTNSELLLRALREVPEIYQDQATKGALAVLMSFSDTE
jgi:transcriptional regulator with XRE-family HTH domain|tara:strand:+ start:20811 stop:21341 length:531 start_codon:yes stop_codon:yes gene_type:complete